MQSNALQKLYLSGLTLRQIGAKIGLAHTTVLYHLRKAQGYRTMVSNTLMRRVINANHAYTTARTRAKHRRLKLDLLVLQQRRPLLYAQLLDASRPQSCSACAQGVTARPAAGMWIWACAWCGAGGIERMKGVAEVLRNRAL